MVPRPAVAAAASPGNSETQILKPHPRPNNSETMGVGPDSAASLLGDRTLPHCAETRCASSLRAGPSRTSRRRLCACSPHSLECSTCIISHPYNDPSELVILPHFTGEKTSFRRLNNSAKIIISTQHVAGLDLKPKPVDRKGDMGKTRSHTHQR